jgi:hypothetical protein
MKAGFVALLATNATFSDYAGAPVEGRAGRVGVGVGVGVGMPTAARTSGRRAWAQAA